MAGLIEQQMAAEQAEQAEQGQPMQQEQQLTPAAPEEGEVPDEIDEAVERVVEAGRTILYDESGFTAVMQQLQDGAGDPAETLANIAFTLIMTLDEKSGGSIPEEALIPAAAMLLEEVISIAEDAGVMQVDDGVAGRAVQAMVGLAIENGIIDAEDVEAMMADMDPNELQAMIAEQEQIAAGGAMGADSGMAAGAAQEMI